MALPTLTVSLQELLGEDGEGLDLSDRIVNQAGQCLCDAMRPEIREQIKQSVDLRIKEQIGGMIDKVFSEVLYDTDSYGRRRTDQPFTMTELVVKKAVEYLEKRVDERGQDSGYSDKNMSRVMWIAKKAAEEIVAKELAPVVEQAKAEIKAQVGNKLAAAFKAALKDAAACFA